METDTIIGFVTLTICCYYLAYRSDKMRHRIEALEKNSTPSTPTSETK